MDGMIGEDRKTHTLSDAGEVIDWFRKYPSAVALGVDTLLAWSLRGKRACDDALRSRYREHASSVIHQNSLYSSMTINGILVAQKLDIPLLAETHPKLLRKAGLTPDNLEVEEINDHEADALVAAWCASRWYFKGWQKDLYKENPGDLIFPAGRAVYPWPE